VNLKEEFEDLPVADTRGIEDDLDRFRVSRMIAVRRMGVGAAGVADAGRQNSLVAANKILHAPEATAGKHSAFLSHFTSSTWFK
jgi:hypothetical protein